MIKPLDIRKAFEKVEDKNWEMRAFLKEQDEDEIDELINSMHRELFKDYNCISCSNCCKEIVPKLSDDEIQIISSKLNISVDEFINKYLIETEDGLQIKQKPCVFLGNEGCQIYEFRPIACKEYPYTDKNEMSTRLMSLVCNSEVCPVVFEIFDRLKKFYGYKFKKYCNR